jgi:hypothetical protein
VPCNVEVQDPAASVLDDEQTVQHPEGRSWHAEEVEGNGAGSAANSARQSSRRARSRASATRRGSSARPSRSSPASGAESEREFPH